MADNVIEMADLERRFGSLVAVKKVTFNVGKGEFFGLLGPNGAGKTTLLKLLTGQLEPTSGSCKVMGINPAEDPIAVKRSIGIVPEVESPPSFLTGKEYLEFIGLIRAIGDIEKRAAHWIEFMDMGEVQNTPCKDLSKGTRQKLMVAAALIHEPPLVFMDEPFAGLDPHYQKLVREYLQNYLKGGGTVFMCTHILEIAEKLCTKIGIISRGEIVAMGSPRELMKDGEALDSVFMRFTENASATK